MPKLCLSEECTACAACRNICPRSAIRMEEDSRGFLHPIVHSDKCIECRLCEKICPVLNKSRSTSIFEPMVFAAWHSDKDIRISSSSGGAFSAFAEKTLNEGGVVFGAAWDGVEKVRHIGIEKAEDLGLLRKSKYVQSDIGDTFQRVKEILKSGRKVLFSGTPCQVGGLYGFLGNMDISHLTTIDFICHGVPSSAVYRSYLEYIGSKYGSSVSMVNFRDKSLGVETNLLLKVGLVNGKTKRLVFDDNSFYRGFVGNVYLRESCHRCGFNKLPRIADISMADYRGLGKNLKFGNIGDRPLGFTGLIVNSQNGLNLLNTAYNISFEQRPNEELFRSQPHLNYPAKKSSVTEDFWDNFGKIPYKEMAKKYMPMPIRFRIMNFLRIVLGVKLFYSLGRLLKI